MRQNTWWYSQSYTCTVLFILIYIFKNNKSPHHTKHFIIDKIFPVLNCFLLYQLVIFWIWSILWHGSCHSTFDKLIGSDFYQMFCELIHQLWYSSAMDYRFATACSALLAACLLLVDLFPRSCWFTELESILVMLCIPQFMRLSPLPRLIYPPIFWFLLRHQQKWGW